MNLQDLGFLGLLELLDLLEVLLNLVSLVSLVLLYYQDLQVPYFVLLELLENLVLPELLEYRQHLENQ